MHLLSGIVYKLHTQNEDPLAVRIEKKHEIIPIIR
jgi:hypothetical protein